MDNYSIKLEKRLKYWALIGLMFLMLVSTCIGEHAVISRFGNKDGIVTPFFLPLVFLMIYMLLGSLLLVMSYRITTKPIIIIRFIVIMTILTIFVSLAFVRLGKPQVGIDDANIFFVYAKHFVQNYGFVYNIGGERVEGFSSLLWVLIIAVFFKLTTQPEWILLTINIIIVSITTLLITEYLVHLLRNYKKVGQELYCMSMYMALICMIPDYIVWMTLPLMDTALWSFLFVMLTILVLQLPKSSFPFSIRLFSLLLVLFLLTRPEAMLWSIVFIIGTWTQAVFMTNIKQAFHMIKLPLLTYMVTLTFLTVFRLNYFGYPFPNTYYAKISPSLSYNLYMGFRRCPIFHR